MMKNILFLLTIFSLIGCTDEDIIEASWDYTDFKAINSYQPFQDVKPAYDFDYWELIKHNSNNQEVVQFRFGAICKDANEPMKCAFSFFKMDQMGINFSEGSNSDESYYYLKSNQQDYNKIWDSIEELKSFLGPIDSEGDALLVAAANGYYFEKDDINMSGIRKTNDGYDIIGLKTIKVCEPLQINQYFLKIDKNGNLDATAEKAFIDDEKKCLLD